MSSDSGLNDSDQDLSDRHSPGISPPRTQYELARDGNYEHLEHADEDFQRATQKFRSRDVTQGDNCPAESGIVQRIECINFMCHDRLVVELGPLINFIVGENGSGKSAVLTALTLCLGGKASSTNRGGNLKSFIKEGRDHTSLSVKIKNEGPDAFQPDLYGSSITVERHFSRSGTGFKVKNALGKIISTKKAEVDDISEWYCLQMDNPLNVLSQDNARQFLNSSTPAQKYKFFVQGVQLEQLDNDYKIVMETSQELEDRRDALIESVAEAEKTLLAAERLREVVSKNAEMRERARHYINQLSWAQVAEQERALDQIEQVILNLDERITAADQAIEEKTSVLEEAGAHLETAKESFSRIQAHASGLDDAVAEAEDTYQRAKFDVQSLHTEERDIYGRLKNADNTVKNIQQKMREEENRLDQASRSNFVEKEAELEAARNEESEIKSKCREMQDKIPLLEMKRDEEKKTLEELMTGPYKRVADEIGRSKDHIESLKRGTGSVHNGMPSGMQALIERIAKATTFNKKPIGPLGAYIQLLKPEWAELIQTYLKGALTSFVVTSLADQRRLANMMTELRVDCNIIISNGHHLHVPDELDVSHDTIFRVLKFENELVRDQLIINNFIDKTILMTERPEAEDVVKNARALKGCLTYMNSKHLRGMHLTKNSSGLVNSKSLSLYKGRPIIKTDGEAQIQYEQKRVTHLAQELRRLQDQQRHMQHEIRRRGSELDGCKADLAQLKQQVLQVQVHILDLQEQLDAFEGVDDRLNGLRDELNEWRATKETIGEQYGGMNLEKRKLHEKVEEYKLKLTSARTDKEALIDKIHKAEAKVRQCEDARRLALAEKNNAYESRDMAIDKKSRYNAKRDYQKKVIEQFTVHAQECCPYRVHISEDETFKSIQQKFRSLNAKLVERETAQGATDQEINERAEKAKAAHDEVKRSKTIIETELNLIKLSLSQRIEKWRRFQRLITARTRVQFLYLLSERGYRGDLQIDHRGRKLALEVEPDQTQKRAAGRNTKTLSGGEKSFSSICMLLAIWEAMGSPIRCLDEFDVFMDNVNRAISTNMLIKAARNSVTRQYILITPNAIEGRAKLDKDVKIIRLTDPRQRTLPVMISAGLNNVR